MEVDQSRRAAERLEGENLSARRASRGDILRTAARLEEGGRGGGDLLFLLSYGVETGDRSALARTGEALERATRDWRISRSGTKPCWPGPAWRPAGVPASAFTGRQGGRSRIASWSAAACPEAALPRTGRRSAQGKTVWRSVRWPWRTVCRAGNGTSGRRRTPASS